MKITSNIKHPDIYLKYRGKIATFDNIEVLIIGYTIGTASGISLVMTPTDKSKMHSLCLKNIINEPNTYIEKEFKYQNIHYLRWSGESIKLKE